MWTHKRAGGGVAGATLAAAILCVVCSLPAAPAASAGASAAQQKDPPPEGNAAGKPSSGQQSDSVTIHIEVTGGEKNKPVEGASVYVRYTEPRKLHRDQKVEMNFKTTPQGKARVPYVPKGSVIIQVIAQGWKTFGKTYEITEEDQMIKIHLDPPHKWY